MLPLAALRAATRFSGLAATFQEICALSPTSRCSADALPFLPFRMSHRSHLTFASCVFWPRFDCVVPRTVRPSVITGVLGPK